MLLAAAMLTIAGCSYVPNMDSGGMGCQNARGIGPTEGAVPNSANLIGKSPAEAASIAVAAGHTVVFNVQIPGYGECWCTTPPGGTVTMAWWGQHGALWLMVEGVNAGHTPDHQPLFGWGC